MTPEQKANELRIGNLYIDIDDKLCEMSGYELWQMSVKENNETLGVNEYKPIPLTEEWLLEFGFTSLNRRINDYNTTYHLTAADSLIEVHLKTMTLLVNECAVVCEYVHQIQNLYFVLTGDELEIKNPSTT